MKLLVAILVSFLTYGAAHANILRNDDFYLNKKGELVKPEKQFHARPFSSFTKFVYSIEDKKKVRGSAGFQKYASDIIEAPDANNYSIFACLS